jgi:5-methylcytosine-specific restriction protein A
MFAAIAAVIDAKARPLTGDDDRTAGERQAEALAEVCGYVLDHAPASVVPECGGQRPHLNVLVRLEDLENRARAGCLDFGGPVSPDALRMLCCDGAVVPIVLDGAGQPLDVGRITRAIPDGLRRAVAARDRGCAHPGCDRPPSWCECHHIVPWEHGGDTKLSNLAMLCRATTARSTAPSGSAGSAAGCPSSSHPPGSTRNADHDEKPCRISSRRDDGGIRTASRHRVSSTPWQRCAPSSCRAVPWRPPPRHAQG